MSVSKQIIFIDAKVPDYQSLVAGLPADAIGKIIDANSDGLQQIADALKNSSDLDAIQIISHGATGSLQLGNSTLNLANLADYSQALTTIGDALTATGDILLYGCDVAQGDAGQQFINQLAQYTGADVAASTDLTGNSALGGNWVLEANTGSIETAQMAITAYRDVLVSPDIVISQVYGGGGSTGATYQNDFIELYNRGTTAVDLSGWSVQYASAAGVWSSTTTLPSFVLLSGQYFLIQEAGGATGLSLPTPDTIGSVNMSATTGKVQLLNASAAVIDMIGYGATTVNGATPANEGGASASALNPITADFRNGFGTIDTDNNGNDFTAAAVSPRNTATPFYIANTPPVSTTNAGLTLLEDAAITPITTALLNVTDAEQAASALTYTLTSATSKGTVTNNGTVLGLSSTFTQADIDNNLIQFTPSLNANGSDSFGFSVSDGVGGTLSNQTFSIGITAVNDMPAGADTSITTLEDTAYTFSTANFGFTDPNDNPANTLLSVIIATLPTAGSLQLSGVPVIVDQAIHAGNITSGLLKFVPVTNANGSSYDNFTFKVQDTGGTANSGVDTDSTANTLTINVTALNDMPAGIDRIVTTLINTDYTFGTTDFRFTDSNDSPANSLLNVIITTLPTDGLLQLNGALVTAGQSISAANIASGLLKFVPTANVGGNGISTSFTFKIQDNGGTTNGGVDTDSTANMLSILIVINNPPTLGTPANVDYTDTAFVDAFTTVTGTLFANNVDANTALTYGITGGTDNITGTTVSKSNAYGILTVTKATGAYSFVANSAAIEPLNSNVTDNTLNVTVSDGALSASQAFTVSITQSGATESIGNDSLVGTVGNDVFNGLTGVDTMVGGLGNDTYVVSNSSDIIIENTNAGWDTVWTGVNYALSNNVEALWMSAGAGNISGYGNYQANYMVGNEGNNLLDGQGGADTMVGGLGNDSYYVDNVGDVVVEQAGQGTDTVYASISYTLGANVENLTLTGTTALNGTGNSDANIITGNSAANILNGGTGADTMIGGAGNDGYYVDNAGDVIIENAYAGLTLPQQWDYVYSTAQSYTLSANVEALVLVEGSAATTAVGNTGYNYLVGNSAANIFDGKGGGDFMVGGAGNDTYNVYNSYDNIVEYAGEGWDTVWTMGNYALPVNVEALLFYNNAGNSNGYGNNDANYIVGNNYNNLLDGQGGNDSLTGGEGADTLVGGLGQDRYDLAETVAATDTLRIATGDSTVGFGNYDFAVGFKLGTDTVSTTGVDQLDLVSTTIAANAIAVNGTNAGAIMSHSITNGMISFAASDTYAAAPIALTDGYLSDVFNYLQANIAGSQTVGFVCSGNTYVFQDAGVTDTLVELVGVTATSLNNTGLAANSVWIV